MSTQRQQFILRPWTIIVIALLPLIAFILASLLLERSAPSFEWMPKEFVEFDASRAQALRLDAFGNFLLFSTGAIGAFFYFFYTLRLLQRPLPVIVFIFFVVANAVLAAMLVPSTRSQVDKFMGSALVCTALGYDDVQMNRAKERAKIKQAQETPPASSATPAPPSTPATAVAAAAAAAQPVKVPVEDARVDRKTCNPTTLAQMKWMLWFNKLAVLLGLTSLVFGSIFCLAGPLAPDPVDSKKDLPHYEEQSERLNTYLYLSALLLVTGLLFISAILHWPTHALLPAAALSFDAHADALTAFYGYIYTIVLASFYIPVAVALSAKVKELKPAAPGAPGVPEAFKGPLQVLKIAAAIFSPSLVGIVTSLTTIG